MTVQDPKRPVARDRVASRSVGGVLVASGPVACAGSRPRRARARHAPRTPAYHTRPRRGHPLFVLGDRV